MPLVPVSVGELHDKISILEIKLERLDDPRALQNVRVELEQLRKLAGTVDVSELKEINETIWDNEEELRECERRQRFDEHFVNCTRTIYKENDRRAKVKKAINMKLNSEIVEEKSYKPY